MKDKRLSTLDVAGSISVSRSSKSSFCDFFDESWSDGARKRSLLL
jgi:hypothetical protein